MTDENKVFKERGALGGKTRSEKLSPEERSEISRTAAVARWGSGPIARATHDGTIQIAGTEITCAVLEGGKRVLTTKSFLTAIGRAEKANTGSSIVHRGEGMPPFLKAANLQPFIPDSLRGAIIPIKFRTTHGVLAFGYEAQLLMDVCDVYLKARLEGKLALSQVPIAQTSELLMRGFAKVGIIALVDEATGYQEERAKDALSKILEAYVVAEMRPWIGKFPMEFFREVFRIHDWEFDPTSRKRPSYVGTFINKHIYECLPLGVFDELKRRNPVTEKGYRKHKHFQFLTEDTGSPHLDLQIRQVLMLMRVSQDRAQFEVLFDRAFGHFNKQQKLPLVIDV